MNNNPQHKTTAPRRFLAAVAFGALFLAAGSPVLRADDDDCRRRIVRADHKLHEATEHHGWDSPEARHWRQELATARSYCWEHNHRWWDEDARRWHTDRDWDDHDHDEHHDH